MRDSSVIHTDVEILVACVLRLMILICYYACSLMYLMRLVCFKYQTKLTLQHGDAYLFSDTEFSDVQIFLSYLPPNLTNAGKIWCVMF